MSTATKKSSAHAATDVQAKERSERCGVRNHWRTQLVTGCSISTVRQSLVSDFATVCRGRNLQRGARVVTRNVLSADIE
jgi:hypothetical protein